MPFVTSQEPYPLELCISVLISVGFTDRFKSHIIVRKYHEVDLT